MYVGQHTCMELNQLREIVGGLWRHQEKDVQNLHGNEGKFDLSMRIHASMFVIRSLYAF